MSISKGKLYILAGICRSGKSTIANQWVNFEIDIYHGHIEPRRNLMKYNMDGQNPRVVVCSDDIRLALHGLRFEILSEEFVHAIQGITIRSQLNRGCDVLVDGTNSKLEHIKRLLYIDNNADYLIVDTSPEVCKQRAIETNQADLIPVIDRMHSQLCVWKNNAKEEINKLREQVKRTV